MANHTDNPGRADCHDVIVIGAGVVGCAVARRFAVEGARVLVLEKAADILDGASKGNSAIMHTGFDAPPGSLEQACMAEGYREYLDIRGRLGLPLEKTGALVIAWDRQQRDRLDEVISRAHANGVADAEVVEGRALYDLEPNLGPGALAAVRVPGEYLVDPWTTPLTYLLQALRHQTTLLRHCEVTGGAFDGSTWVLKTSRGACRGRTVVNCAGLYGDLLHARLLGDTSFEIRPRKGQFLVYDKSARPLLRSILLPVPTEITKGIVVCPTVFGNVLVGPTAEEQEARDDASVDGDILRELEVHGRRILPGLGAHGITATYAGLRPATEQKDYRIDYRRDRGYLLVGGIRSTGLSAALGIAGHVWRLYQDGGAVHTAPATLSWPLPPRLAECGKRDWSQPDNGGIVCHCELVTRREILNALEGEIPVSSLGGLKRRTRVTMGRCQGFYCSAELSELTAGRFSVPLDAAPSKRRQ